MQPFAFDFKITSLRDKIYINYNKCNLYKKILAHCYAVYAKISLLFISLIFLHYLIPRNLFNSKMTVTRAIIMHKIFVIYI